MGVESIINEQDEISSDDEINYDDDFMDQIKHRKMGAKSKKKKYEQTAATNKLPKFNSAKHNSNKYKAQFTNDLYRNRMAKVNTDITKTKAKAKFQPKLSPYMDSDQEITRNKKKYKIKNREMSPPDSSPKLYAAQANSLKNDLHTSSIPTLPSVIRDSRYRENLNKQMSLGIRKRLYQKDTAMDQIYKDLDDVQGYDSNAQSPAETPYSAKGNSRSKGQYPGVYGRHGQGKPPKGLPMKVKKPRFQSAHVHNLKGVNKLNQYKTNHSSFKDLNPSDTDKEEFFARRKNFEDVHDSRLKDIMKKIQDKKNDINKIESKYQSNDTFGYGSTPGKTRTKPKSRLGVNKSANVSPNASKYTVNDIESKSHAQSRNGFNPSSIIKVTPPPMTKHTRTGSKFMGKNQMKPGSKKKAIKKIGNAIGNPRNRRVQKNHRYLNSWEQNDGVEDDDIKEEFVSDNSDYIRKTPYEEGSAATFLLESMSKAAIAEPESSLDSDINDDDDINGAYSSSQFEIFQKARKDNNRMKSATRPYSPPFTQLGKK